MDIYNDDCHRRSDVSGDYPCGLRRYLEKLTGSVSSGQVEVKSVRKRIIVFHCPTLTYHGFAAALPLTEALKNFIIATK
jgi:hypothetical protein